MQTIRDEQRSQAGAQPTTRQRSIADMQELIHGLREEQQQAKQALHACQQAMRYARGLLALKLWEGWARHGLGRIFQRWASAALQLHAGAIAAERDQLAERMRRERRQVETLESQLRAGGYELEERSLRSESLAARVGELQAALARRTEAMAAEAEAARERQLGELRTEHQLALASLGEEHEAATRRTWRRAQRAQQAAASLLPRAHQRRLLGQCLSAWLLHVSIERQVRSLRARYEEEEQRAAEERTALTERLLAAEATASAALTAASMGQEAAEAAKSASERQRTRLESEVSQLRGQEATRPELLASLEGSTAEVERLSAMLDDAKAQIDGLRAALDEQRALASSHAASAAAAVAQREAALAVAMGEASGRAATSELVLAERHEGMVAVATLSGVSPPMSRPIG